MDLQPYINRISGMIRKEDTNEKISYLLYKEIGKGNLDIYAISSDEFGDFSHLYEVYENIETLRPKEDWDFSIEYDFLELLQNGYEIGYMTLDAHCGMWYNVDIDKEEIVNQEGLQKYLKYCVKHHISQSVLVNLQDNTPDIMDLYQEKNAGFIIIASMICQDNAIVLGHNPNRGTPYVTWRTTKDRKGGYDLGHYFTSKKAAFEDYSKRCHKMMSTSLSIQQHRLNIKETSRDER